MGFHSEINETLQKFISEQRMFFTATAPIEGRINLSPKGVDTFRIFDSKTVAYLDLTGSGNETAAHVQQNGRMTIMFCSFSDKPLILRLYGQGNMVHRESLEWQDMHQKFPSFTGERQIIVLEIESVQTSCGFGIPVYELKEERTKLVDWASEKGQEAVENYWREKNQFSIDGLPTNLFS